jgi:hypothetical protein
MTPDALLPQIADRLSHTPSTVHSLIAGLPADAIAFRESDRAWSVFEVVCHLADGEITDWMPRVRAIASGDGRFPAYDREGGFQRYKGWTLTAVVDEFQRLRQQSLMDLAALKLTPAALAQTGVHPEFGSVTLHQLLATWVTHDHAHTAQLSRILVRYYGQDVGPWAKYFSLLATR